MTNEQAIILVQHEHYMRVSVYDRTASNPMKNRELEEVYTQVTGDTKINRGCNTCLLDKIFPRLLIELSDYVPSEEPEEEIDLSDFIKLHHNTQKKKIDKITDVETLELIIESTPYQSVKDYAKEKLK